MTVSASSAPISSVSTAPCSDQEYIRESIAKLPERAQALIAQFVFNKETPRELRSLAGRHVTEEVVPKAAKCGMNVSKEEEVRGTAELEKIQKIAIGNLATRLLLH